MIGIVDYGLGNLRSVSKAVEKLGAPGVVTASPEQLEKAEKLILPGVGAFGDGVKGLVRSGCFETLQRLLNQGKPFLGICLGMQLLFEESEETPGVKGLGLFKGKVRRFQRSGLKVPHMGWNQLKLLQSGHPLFAGLADQSYFYFVHSFYPVPDDSTLVLGTCDYGGEVFPAFVGRENVWACQFHPEKSQDTGLKILKNFVAA